MKIREPLTHWGNFTVPELKKILEHCVALETLGIGQDEEMMHDIERDITLRENKSRNYKFPAKIIKKPTQHSKQEPQYLLEQTA